MRLIYTHFHIKGRCCVLYSDIFCQQTQIGWFNGCYWRIDDPWRKAEMGATDVPFNKTLHYSAAKEYMHAFNDMTRKNTGKGTCLCLAGKKGFCLSFYCIWKNAPPPSPDIKQGSRRLWLFSCHDCMRSCYFLPVFPKDTSYTAFAYTRDSTKMPCFKWSVW